MVGTVAATNDTGFGREGVVGVDCCRAGIAGHVVLVKRNWSKVKLMDQRGLGASDEYEGCGLKKDSEFLIMAFI